MPTIFTRIIDGEIPGTFVHRDEHCVAFLSINPMAAGHTLVVPVAEVDHWVDLPTDLAAHLFAVAHRIGRAQRVAFPCERVGMIIAVAREDLEATLSALPGSWRIGEVVARGMRSHARACEHEDEDGEEYAAVEGVDLRLDLARARGEGYGEDRVELRRGHASAGEQEFERPDVLAEQAAGDVALALHAEDDHRQAVLGAEAEGRGVDDLEPVTQRVAFMGPAEALSEAVFF